MIRSFLLFSLIVAALVVVASKASSPFCAGALMAQARGETPTMPPPGGNADHSEPPKGAWCDRSAAKEHHCECHSKCVHNDDGTISRAEDGPHCRAFCYRDRCRCPWEDCNVPAAQR